MRVAYAKRTSQLKRIVGLPVSQIYERLPIFLKGPVELTYRVNL